MAQIEKRLFNKMINVELIDTSNQTAMQLKTPKTGRKPNIQVTGEFTAAMELANIQLKVTNLYPDKELSSFKVVKVTAGYQDGGQALFPARLKMLIQKLLRRTALQHLR